MKYEKWGSFVLQKNHLECVLKMGSAGDSPAPVGDPPTGMAECTDLKRSSALDRTAVSVPAGESPDGTGGSPVPPKNDF